MLKKLQSLPDVDGEYVIESRYLKKWSSPRSRKLV